MRDGIPRTITLRCHATESGVTEVTFSAALQLRVWSDHFEILQQEASPDDELAELTWVYQSDRPYTLDRAVEAIRDFCQPLGRDFRASTSVEGEDDFHAELLKMAWMGNAWELSDAEELGEDEAPAHALQDVAWLITRLPDGDAERAYDEMTKGEAWDPKLVEALEILHAVKASQHLERMPELRFEDQPGSNDLLARMLERLRQWAMDCQQLAEASRKRFRHFPLAISGRLRATFSTNGADCKYTVVGPGGGRTEENTQRALERVLPSVNKSLLSALREEGFVDLAEMLRIRAEQESPD